MKNSRRDFLKKAALLTTGASLWKALPVSIEKALAIAPDQNTTFYDAEHVVLLMQENRSFDHCFGTLKGVRGFNDPFAIRLPDKNPVWFQANKAGKRYVPFRLDIEKTKSTWMGGLPHSWENQVDARNEGKHDGWLEAKKPNKPFEDIPLTMGYYNRQDIPFYYELADAFTVCDQHFCAALTGTTTNRTFYWTGKTHDGPSDKAKVRNSEVGYDNELNWITFPERLEKLGISWKIYQNEISLPSNAEDPSLLANFTNNNLEWFSQYNVRFSRGYYEYLQSKEKQLIESIAKLEKKLTAKPKKSNKQAKQLEQEQNELTKVKELLKKWSPKHFSELSPEAQRLHKKAFTTNKKDPDYHQVEEMTYEENGQIRKTKVPKGDILHKFRKDVKSGKLPTVSWVIAPEKFSDHPGAPWYGAWYVSAILDILTQNPKVWKKTIFILNYDENDGYFDHIPPFVAPDPGDSTKGKTSEGLDVTGEFVTIDAELKEGFNPKEARTSPVGLGYRVPLIIASPWSRGGWVNSEVCDITSVLQFLEKFLSKKIGKKVEEPNISSWRRAISGDLTSCFRPYHGEKINLPTWLDRNNYIQEIYNAKFRKTPNNFKALSEAEARSFGGQLTPDILPKQEPGIKPSNHLNYELYVDGWLDLEADAFVIQFKADNKLFGKKSLGAPFNVYAPDLYLNDKTNSFEPVRCWNFAVKADDTIEFSWPLAHFKGKNYHLLVYGPNGFFREFLGSKKGPTLQINCLPVIKATKNIKNWRLSIVNNTKEALTLNFIEEKYQKRREKFALEPGGEKKIKINSELASGWYDFTVSTVKKGCQFRYAGRLETGKDTISDPYMGQTI